MLADHTKATANSNPRKPYINLQNGVHYRTVSSSASSSSNLPCFSAQGSFSLASQFSLFLAMEGMVKFQTERVNTEVAVSQFISVRMSKRPLTKMLDTIMEEEYDFGVDQTLRSPIYKSSSCHLTQDYRAGQSC
ncbi:hypothetical protein L3X38_022919 [Prunus dulcis]|uniref:Uncharacterized protein n=1 Tax=Prunus dulcis TaxID=3755 RepID=A0AAD4VWZ5_PRUDU|nr:hypothetical protein L3X38_022919 [Prunus dulcis]